MSWIEPGDYVECIHTASDGHVYIMKGALYKVSTLMGGPAKSHPCASGWTCTEPGLQLEKPNPKDPKLWWCSTYFRPIYRPKNGVFDYLKERPYNYDTVLREIEEENERDNRGSPQPPPQRPTSTFQPGPVNFNLDWKCNFRLPPAS